MISTEHQGHVIQGGAGAEGPSEAQRLLLQVSCTHALHKRDTSAGLTSLSPLVAQIQIPPQSQARSPV